MLAIATPSEHNPVMSEGSESRGKYRISTELSPPTLDRQQRFEQFIRNQGGYLKKGDRSGHTTSTNLPQLKSPKAPAA